MAEHSAEDPELLGVGKHTYMLMFGDLKCQK